MAFKMESVKSEKDLPKGLQDIIEFQFADSGMEAVVVRVGSEYVRICKTESYSNTLKVLKVSKEKKWIVEGNYKEVVKIPGLFDSQEEAQEEINKVEKALDLSAWDNHFSVKEIEIDPESSEF